MPKGTYIAIDGLPGEAKTYVLERVVQELQLRAQPVKLITGLEHNGSLTVQTLHRIAEDKRYGKAAPTATLLAATLLAEELQTIRSLLDQGITCITDHSYLSALVAQYYDHAQPEQYEQIVQLMMLSSQTVSLDLLIIIDALADQQSAAKDTVMPRFERLRAGYLWEAKQRALPVVFASHGKEQLFTDVWQLIAPLVPAAEQPAAPGVSALSIAEVLAGRHTNPMGTSDAPAIPAAEQTFAHSRHSQHIINSLEYLEHIRSGTDIAAERPDYERRDAENHYRFYIPANLQGKIRSHYIKTMNRLFERYTALLENTVAYIRKASSDVSTRQTDAWLRKTLQQARAEVQPVLPVACTLPAAMDNSLRVPRAAAPPALQMLANELLPVYYSAQNDVVRLISYTPHNELDTVSDILYPLCDLPYSTVRTTLLAQAYQRKLDVLDGYFTAAANGAEQKNGLTKIRYGFEVITSFADLIDICGRYGWRGVIWQPLNPRLGYATPELIEHAGLSDPYDECFDMSLELFSTIQTDDLRHEAQYATLQGHKQRWQVTLRLEEAVRFTAETHDQPAIQQLADGMRQAMAEVHPLITGYAVKKPAVRPGA